MTGRVSGSDAARTPVEIRPLPSRLRPPRPHVELVVREALVERLRHTSAPLIVVSAPAGYGKTTLLSQWVEQDERLHAWLQLAGLHDDPVAFLSHLAAALSAVAPVDPGLLELLGAPDAPIDAMILPELCRGLEAAEPFVLVLDDAHLVENQACWAYLELLHRSLPDEARLALASRSEPSLPLARLRASGDVLELRPEDLRLSAPEAAALLAAHGCELQDAELRELLGVTEGWVTGVYLAVLAAGGCPTAELLARLHGDRRAIAEYLTAEVLDRQPADVQEFLVSTSILDQLSPGLCREVTGLPEAGEVLDHITRENLFVTPLDDRDEWFRYHHLFGELLQAQLRRRTPEAERQLHERASGWYAGHGDGERAVLHALAAGDVAGVIDLAARTIDGFECVGQTERARSLLLAFPDAVIMTEPVLALTALMLSTIGPDDRLERLATYAEALEVDDTPSPIGGTSLRTWQALSRALRGKGGVAQMLRDAEFAAANEHGPDVSWTHMALMAQVIACHLSGRTRQVDLLLADLARQHALDDEEHDMMAGLRTLMAAERGDWDEARRLDRQQRLKPKGSMLRELPHTLVLAHDDDPELDAWLALYEVHLREGLGSVEWRMLLSADALAEIALGRGDIAEAERWTAEAEAILKRWPDAGVLRGRTRRLREALEERRMADPLTTAERRVLDLLPTQLTADQIATRLFLTKNTVKSHMSHIYRKLEVKTRTGAVDAARRLRLL
jgi:LuxR family transcriptional regulator, maltose regulon positive regulatory protein